MTTKKPTWPDPYAIGVHVNDHDPDDVHVELVIEAKAAHTIHAEVERLEREHVRMTGTPGDRGRHYDAAEATLGDSPYDDDTDAAARRYVANILGRVGVVLRHTIDEARAACGCAGAYNECGMSYAGTEYEDPRRAPIIDPGRDEYGATLYLTVPRRDARLWTDRIRLLVRAVIEADAGRSAQATLAPRHVASIAPTTTPTTTAAPTEGDRHP